MYLLTGVGAGVGLFLLLILLSPTVTITADRIKRTLTIQRSRLVSRKSREIPVSEIAAIQVESTRSSSSTGRGSSTVYRVVVVTKGNETIPFTATYSSGSASKEQNARRLRGQLSKFFTFDGPHAALLLNNADWLCQLNYILGNFEYNTGKMLDAIARYGLTEVSFDEEFFGPGTRLCFCARCRKLWDAYLAAHGLPIDVPLERIAQETGGTYFFTPSPEGLAAIYETISRRIKNEYVITFETGKRGEYLRNVSLEVKKGTRAGRAYFQPKSSLFRVTPRSMIAYLFSPNFISSNLS